MRCDILTLFPAPVEAYLTVGVLGRAAASGLLDLRVHDLRRWAINRYGQVDDEPYGGGPGMVLMASAVVPAVRGARGRHAPRRPGSCSPTPAAARFTTQVARELAGQAAPALRVRPLRGVRRAGPRPARRRRDLARATSSSPAASCRPWRSSTPSSRHLPGVVGDAGLRGGRLLHLRPARPPGLHAAAQLRGPRRARGAVLRATTRRSAAGGSSEALRLTLRRRPDLLALTGSELSDETRRLARDAGCRRRPALAARHPFAARPLTTPSRRRVGCV